VAEREYRLSTQQSVWRAMLRAVAAMSCNGRGNQ
jgi:hypothetical protein